MGDVKPQGLADLIRKMRADIGRLGTELVEIEVRMAALRSEIADLEAAERVIRRYEEAETPRHRGQNRRSRSDLENVIPRESGAIPAVPARSDELFGKSIKEASKIVLEEVESANYGEIALRAIDRGYRSHKSGDDAGKITRSFYETMRRNPDEFVQAGPVFRLRRDGDPRDRPGSADDDEDVSDRTTPKSLPEHPPMPPAPEAESYNYDATIDWGDGTTSTGSIRAVLPGIFRVGGLHTYDRPGAYPLSVLLRTTRGTDPDLGKSAGPV